MLGSTHYEYLYKISFWYILNKEIACQVHLCRIRYIIFPYTNRVDPDQAVPYTNRVDPDQAALIRAA